MRRAPRAAPVDPTPAVGRPEKVMRATPVERTEQKAMEAKVNSGPAAGESGAIPERFRVLADQAPFVIYHTDVDGQVIYCNPAWTALSGFTLMETIDTRWIAAVHPDDRDRVVEEWSAVVASGRSEYSTALRIQCKDGSVRHMQTTTSLFLEAGEPVGYIGAAMDVTEQIRSEQQLRESNQLLETVLANIPCGVTVFDPSGKLRLHNRLICELTGLPESAFHERAEFVELLRAYSERYQRGWEEADLQARVQAALTDCRRISEESLHDGRVMEIRRAPMPEGGIVTIYTDVSRHRATVESLRRAKAEAEQAAQAKSAFLAVMSHEIRTPISGVSGMTALLLQTRLTRDQREMLEVLRQSSESLAVVINDILDFSRYDSGAIELEWIPLRPADLVSSSVRLLESKAAEKGIQVEQSIAEDVPLLVFGDEVRLRQVLVNLLSNAVKFTESGRITIALAVARQETVKQSGAATGDMLTLEVRVTDTGVGIPASSQRRLFEPFVQADTSTARRFGGTGLGLAICKRLVRGMGGSIDLKSQVGVGTEVRFTFLAEAAVPASRTARFTNLEGRRIALVGASPSETALLGCQLKRWGVQQQSYAAASDVLADLHGMEDRIDVLVASDTLADCAIPSLLASIRNLRPELPIILLSSSGEPPPVETGPVAAVLPRNPAESALHQALLAALSMVDAGPARTDPQHVSAFDKTLAERLPLRILVAEDNEINAKVARRMLNAFGYEATLVQNGLQAVDAVRQGSYDLVLMDIHMPVMDGLQATRSILNKLALTHYPRVVATTASVMREEIAAALAAGADACLGKPFSASELRGTLEETAARARSVTAKPTASHIRRSLDGPYAGVLAVDRLCSYLELDDGRAFLESSIAAFCTDAKRAAGRLGSAAAVGDARELKAAAHELSNLGGALGVIKVVNGALNLEEIATRGDVKGAAPLVQQCARDLQEGIASLADFVFRARKAATAA